jgi:hypothetical protein
LRTVRPDGICMIHQMRAKKLLMGICVANSKNLRERGRSGRKASVQAP